MATGRSGAMVPKIAALVQLAMAAFVVAQYLEDWDHAVMTVLLAGLLTFTAIGLLRARPWGLPAALVVNSGLVILMWAVALDRRTVNVVVGAAAFSIPWLLLFPSWWRNRRRSKQNAEPDEPPPYKSTAEPLETPSGWTTEWGGGRVKFWSMLLFGILLLAAGLGILLDGEVVLGVSILGFAVALVGATPLFRSWDRDGRVSVREFPERGEKGLVFPYSRSKMLAATIASAGMAVTCGGIALGAFNEQEGPPPKGLVAFGILGGAFFGWIALRSLLRTGWRGGFVALTKSGILARSAAAKCFVPWGAIDDVKAVETTVHVRGTTTNEPFIGLSISDLDLVEMPPAGRLFATLDSHFVGTDINFPARALDVDPGLLLEALVHYWKTPAARAALGRSSELPDEVRHKDGGPSKG